MEKIMELFKNKRFMLIFTSFIGLIVFIILIRRNKAEPIKDDGEAFKNELKDEIKSIKGLIKKNKELEEKAHGKSISKSNSTGKPKPTKSDDDGEKGKGKTAEIIDDESDESDDDESEIIPE